MYIDVKKETEEDLKKLLNKRIAAKTISKFDKFLLAGFGGTLSSALGLSLTGATPAVAVGTMALTSAGILGVMIKSKIDGDKKAKEELLGDHVLNMQYSNKTPQEYAKENRLSLEQKKEFFKGIIPQQNMVTRISQTFEELPLEVNKWGEIADQHYEERAEARAAFNEKAEASKKAVLAARKSAIRKLRP